MSQEIDLATEEMEVENTNPLEDHAKKVIEALLFASNTPLPVSRIREVLSRDQEMKTAEVLSLIHALQKEYVGQKRAIQIEEIAGGFILRTTEDYSEYVQQLYRDKKGERLSQAAREVLAIIAFKQPVTKPQIEAVRGVDSSATVQILVEKELVEAVGQAEAPGRPTLYAVTNRFLSHFGLKSVDDLASSQSDDGKPDPEDLELN